MPQLIHLQWFYELAEKPPGSSKAYVTYTGKDTALLQRLLHCLNTRLCVKYLHCSVLPATMGRRVPRATTSVTDAISQYSGADKRGFCIWPAFLFPVLKYKRPKLLLPTPPEECEGGKSRNRWSPFIRSLRYVQLMDNIWKTWLVKLQPPKQNAFRLSVELRPQ